MTRTETPRRIGGQDSECDAGLGPIGIDMTHAARIKTGTGVYVQQLRRALLEEEGVHLTEVAPRAMRKAATLPGKVLRGMREASWTQLGLAAECRAKGLRLLHAPAFVSGLRLPCPLVVTVHDLAYIHCRDNCSSAWRWYLRLLMPRVLAKAAAVIVASEHTKMDLVSMLNVPEEKVRVVYHGVDHARFHPIDRRSALDEAAERYALHRPFVLHVGALAPRKNLPLLVRAFARLKQSGAAPQHQLVLAGEEAPGLHGLSAIEEEVRRQRLTDDVLFLGHVADEGLPSLYNLAGALVMPSLYEGFGLPPLEAMACGTPVIVSNGTSLPEVVGDAGLRVDPKDADSLAEAMRAALLDDGLRADLRERGLVRAQRFTWALAACETAAVYRAVLAMNHYEQRGRLAGSISA